MDAAWDAPAYSLKRRRIRRCRWSVVPGSFVELCLMCTWMVVGGVYPPSPSYARSGGFAYAMRPGDRHRSAGRRFETVLTPHRRRPVNPRTRGGSLHRHLHGPASSRRADPATAGTYRTRRHGVAERGRATSEDAPELVGLGVQPASGLARCCIGLSPC
jgi:hypothetical protein